MIRKSRRPIYSRPNLEFLFGMRTGGVCLDRGVKRNLNGQRPLGPKPTKGREDSSTTFTSQIRISNLPSKLWTERSTSAAPEIVFGGGGGSNVTNQTPINSYQPPITEFTLYFYQFPSNRTNRNLNIKNLKWKSIIYISITPKFDP